MALKQGWIPIERLGQDMAEPFYWARYVDWFFTTPLLLLDLALLAGATKEAIVWLLGLDVLMIATGFFAGITASDIRYVWFAVSTVIFIWLLWVLLSEILKSAKQRSPEVRAKFNQLAIILAVVWSIYPILWLLGTEGFNVIGITGEIATFMVIDLIAKVGFGFLLLSNRKVLEAARPSTT
jgi:bacteriorhodopsin